MNCEKDNVPKLDPRLSAVAEFVPNGSSLLDVGTDHGYLPVNLLCRGRISFAGASDINSAPLAKSVDTAERAGVADHMRFYLSDGLASVDDIERYNCISVCGMGGELIYNIIDRAAYIRKSGIPLVLQPMSSIEDLSHLLASGGYSIERENIVGSAGKLYRVMLVRYTGESYKLTEAEHILGRANIAAGRNVFSEYLDSAIARYKKIAAGRRGGGLDCERCDTILRELCAVKNSLEEK